MYKKIRVPFFCFLFFFSGLCLAVPFNEKDLCDRVKHQNKEKKNKIE